MGFLAPRGASSVVCIEETVSSSLPIRFGSEEKLFVGSNQLLLDTE